MRVVIFCHSLVSDWNHGNAHFLRGIASELAARGHAVDVWEPHDAWSRVHLEAEHGEAPLAAFARAYPELKSRRFDLGSLDIDAGLDDADLVLVHEWNDAELVRRIGAHRRDNGGYRLLFHDTHHRSVSDRRSIAAYELAHYDGVLAFGNVVRDLYRDNGWSTRAWTWHEAADVRRFHPIAGEAKEGDLVWIGNWGDDERTAELHEFLIEPARRLRLRGAVYGVRYPDEAVATLALAGLE
ncbi:MAG: glycosyltransferase, partial [Rhizobacter sp.]|nr:glycosyltransferase [Rhizobacter sp.]